MEEAFWTNTHQIPEGQTRFWHIGPLRLWIRRLPGEWQVAHRVGDDDSDESTWNLAAAIQMPDDIEYRRFAFDSTGDDDCLMLRPAMADRPIVSRPDVSLEVPPGGNAEIICGVPLWVEILAGTEAAPVSLLTIPTKELSKTWFGTPQDGEACYASATKAVRNHRLLPPLGFRVLCPVAVTNHTTEHLPIERICIRVEHLAIYQGDQYLWSNRMRVTKLSQHQTSRVTFGKKAPKLDPEATLVALPREKTDSVISQTFNTLKSVLVDQL